MNSGALPKWFVAFSDGARPVWWQRGLRRGFRHVEAFAWDGDARAWVVVSPACDICVVRAMPADVGAAYLAELHKRKATVVLAETACDGPGRPRLLATCVTAISSVLGLPGLCAVTPYGLYRTLLHRGATKVAG